MKIRWRSTEGILVALLELENDDGLTETLASVEVLTTKDDVVRYRGWTCLGGLGAREYQTKVAAKKAVMNMLRKRMRMALMILGEQDNSDS